MKNNNLSLPYVFVLGNEKGGAGKTTCAMHLIVGLMNYGFKVSSIDVDHRQRSLTRYIENRKKYKITNNNDLILMPSHYVAQASKHDSIKHQETEEKESFVDLINSLKASSDIIVIDTPGSYSYLSRLAHSYADMIITPINDSFIDLDLLTKVDPSDHNKNSPSIYSEMIWEQKMEKAKREQGSIEWVVLKNRLNYSNAKNKQTISDILDKLAKRIGFKHIPGFSERVIFRELFLQGLTLLDLIKYGVSNTKLTLSHIAARQELRNFLSHINIKDLIRLKEGSSREIEDLIQG